MYTYRTTIRMHHVDAAGRLFFANQLILVHDAWEACLSEHGLGLAALLTRGEYLTVVVRAEADYSAPLGLGEAVAICVNNTRLGRHSFTVEFAVHRETGKLAGRVRLVYAVIDGATGEPLAVPESLRGVLLAIGGDASPPAA